MANNNVTGTQIGETEATLAPMSLVTSCELMAVGP
jgi:hypothetical protein